MDSVFPRGDIRIPGRALLRSIFRSLLLHWQFLVLCSFLGTLYAITLTQYPPVFVDEPWMAERAFHWLGLAPNACPSFPVSFGDVPDVAPLYSWLESLFISRLGFNLLAIRLPTYFAFLGTLVIWYLLLWENYSRSIALLFTVFFPLQLLVWNAAHIARPEMGILFLLSLGLRTCLSGRNSLKYFWSGAVSSLSFYFSPAGLVAPFVVGGLLFFILRARKEPLTSSLLLFGAGVAGVIVPGLLWIGVSHYWWAIRGPVRSLNIPMGFWQQFSMYLRALWTFQMGSQFHFRAVLLVGLVVLMVLRAVADKLKKVPSENLFSLPLQGLVLTLLYFSLSNVLSRVYFVYLSPWLLLGFILLISRSVNIRWLRTACYLMVLGFGVSKLVVYLTYYQGNDFGRYANRLRALVPRGSKVLGRIQNRLIFDEGYQFVAIEDLDLAGKTKSDYSTEKYIRETGVQYIIFDEDVKKNDRTRSPELQVEPFVLSRGEVVGGIQDVFFGARRYDVLPFWDDYGVWTEARSLERPLQKTKVVMVKGEK